jgi:hypothetical protein
MGETGGMTGSFIASLLPLIGERVGALCESVLCLSLSGAQVLEAFFEGGDLAEPCPFFGLDNALPGVLGHFVDAAELGGIHASEPATGAGFTELVDDR